MKIVFKCHTPFTMMMSIILAEIYFKESENILITSFLPNENFCKNALRLSVFSEIVQFNEGVKSISGVEKQVDDFLQEHSDIDMFFLCVLSDRFSNLLTYRLKKNAKICLYPEGSSVVNLQKKLPFIFNVTNKEKHVKNFFDKYPISFDNYDQLWTFDFESASYFKKEIFKIDIKEALDENFIAMLNELYSVDKIEFENIDAVYLDDSLVERGWLFSRTEKEILDKLFGILDDRKVLIKAHPGQDLTYIKTKFSYANCEVFENINIPWEIIFLNILKNKKISLISPIFSTSFITSAYFVDEKNKLELISLFNLLKKYMNEYLINSIKVSEEYYKKLACDNIKVMFPNDIVELSKIFDTKKENISSNEINYTKRYFDLIGNMICQSYIYVNQNQYIAFFDGLEEEIELKFMLGEGVKTQKIDWILDSMDFFEINSDIEVELYGESYKHIFVLKEENKTKDVWRFELTDNNILLREIHIKFRCIPKNNCIDMLKKMKRTYWRGSFWEKWTELEDLGVIDCYLRNLSNEEIWIYGKGRIGEKIKEKLIEHDITVKFIESNKNESKKVYGISYISKRKELPKLLIITPMQDYTKIFYSLPEIIREQTVSLDEFLKLIEQNKLNYGESNDKKNRKC